MTLIAYLSTFTHILQVYYMNKKYQLTDNSISMEALACNEKDTNIRYTLNV